MPSQVLRLPSKYLVEVRSFWSTTQFTLLLQQNELKKFSMEKDEKQTQVETFSWQILLDVQVSPRVPTEFTIDILPVMQQNMRLKERAQLMQSGGTKTNTCTQLVLHCAERDRLVSELKHIIYVKNMGGKPLIELTCWHQSELPEDRSDDKPAAQRNFSRLKLPSSGQGQAETVAAASKAQHQVCKAKVYPTAIHMIVDRQSNKHGKRQGGERLESSAGSALSDKREAVGEILPSSNAIGSLLVSGIPANFDALDTQNMMESRIMMGGSDNDEEDEAAARSLFKANTVSNNFLISRPFQTGTPTTQVDFGAAAEDLRAEQELELYNKQLEQARNDDDFLGLGSDRQDDGNQVVIGDPAMTILGPGTQITSYNVPNAYNQTRDLQQHHKDRYSQHAIYLSELAQVIWCQSLKVVSLVKANQEIEQIIFKDDDSQRDFLTQLENCYSDSMKKPVPLFHLAEGQSLRTKVEFLNWPRCRTDSCDCERTSFRVDVDLMLAGNTALPNYSLQLDQLNLYLVSNSSLKPVKQMPLALLQILRIVDDSPSCNLILTFAREVQINVNARTFHERERLISSILTMRTLAMGEMRGVASLDNLKILHNRPVDHCHKIQAYSPIEDPMLGHFVQSLTVDYECSLIRKLSELMASEVQTMQLDNVIDEILLNATFSHVTKVPEAFVRLVMSGVQQCLVKYMEYEEQKPDIIDVCMEKGSLPMRPEERVTFLSHLYRRKQKQKDSKGAKEEYNLFKNERHLESLKQYQESLEQTVRYLNVMKSLLNSRVFMQEMAKQDAILQHLTLMLMSKSPVISLLAGQVIRATCHHFSSNEHKIERSNKRAMIRGSPRYEDGDRPAVNSSYSGRSNHMHPSLYSMSQQVYKNPGRRGYFFEAAGEYLKYFERVYDESGLIMSARLTSLGLILNTMFLERHMSTEREDMAIFVEMISRSDYVTDDRAANKPIFQLFDKFCLLEANFFDVQYLATMVLTQSLNYYFEQQDWGCLTELQNYILTYSIQFIWHLYLQMSSKTSHQRTLSIKLLSRLLHYNAESHDLLLRILPETLFLKVKANKQTIDSLQWNFPQWIEFFTQIVPRNFNSATEQWNDETREELTQKLLEAKSFFIETKKLNAATLADEERRELLLPVQEFSGGMIVISHWKNLKWNYREFRVGYDCLASEFLVGKYFLNRLLMLPASQSPREESDQPQLSMNILEPALFWNELLMQFMATTDLKEQRMIIMTMCVLYRLYFEPIGEMKTIPYWLKLVEHPESAHLHFLLLQLVHVALSVRADVARANMRLLIKSKGLLVLHNCMNLVFRELPAVSSSQDVSKMGVEQPVLEDAPDKEINSEIASDTLPLGLEDHQLQANWDRINFTDSSQLTRYLIKNSKTVCSSIIALRIVEQVFTSTQFQYHVPMPSNVEYMLQRHALATLAQSVLLQNKHVTREVLRFIEQHLCNHFTLYKLKDSGLIEFLILALNGRNGDRALNLLMKMQEVCVSFNEGLEYSKFDTHDLQLIKEDKDFLFSQLQQEEMEHRAYDSQDAVLNDIAERPEAMMDKDPNTPLFDQVYYKHKREGKQLPLVLESIFLRYLPTPFIKFLYERGKHEFLAVYRAQSYRHPILIWNREQREILEAKITQTAKTFLAELTEFAHDPSRCMVPTDIPLYKECISSVVKYDEIEREVRCGRYYLSVWVEQAKANPSLPFHIPLVEEQEFHIKMKAELKQCIAQQGEGQEDREKIIILLKSCLLALKKFQDRRIMCLSEINRILQHTMSETSQDSKSHEARVQKKTILFTSMRIIQMAIQVDERNRGEMLAMDGVKFVHKIIAHILLFKPARDAPAAPPLPQSDDIPVQESFITKGEDSLNETGQMASSESAAERGEESIDRIDTKTLNLCVDSMTLLINEDVRAFMDLSLSERIAIFRQISQLLDISFLLYPLLEYRQQNPPLSTSALASNAQPTDAGSERQSEQERAAKLISSSGKSSQSVPPAQPGSAFAVAKPRGGKCIDFDYSAKTLISIINDSLDKSEDRRPDAYSVCLIFNMTSAVFRLLKSVAIYPLLHPELIASGLLWRTIQHCFFDLTEKLYRRSAILKSILKDCTISLKLLVTFVDKFMKCRPEEQGHFKALANGHAEKEIIQSFHACIKKLFSIKILEKLWLQFVITRDLKLEYNADSTLSNDFLRLFASQQLQSPELVWNDQTRAELKEKLASQITLMTSEKGLALPVEAAFCEEIRDFEYSVNRTELRIQGIFVKYFNEQCRTGNLGTFSQGKLARFADQIIEQLIEFTAEADLHHKNVLELVEAFKNLVISLKLVIKSEQDFEHYFETLCNLIKLGDGSPSRSSWDISDAEKKRLKELSSHILQVFRTLVQRRLQVPQFVQQPQQAPQNRNQNRLSYRGSLLSQVQTTPYMIDSTGRILSTEDYLLQCQSFFKLLVKVTYEREIQVVAFKEDVVPMINELIAIPEFVMHLFIDRGLIIFLLNLIFDKAKYGSIIGKEMRATLTDQVLKIDRIMQSIDRGNLLAFSERQSSGIVKAFVPTSFFAEINEQMWRMRTNNQAELLQQQLLFLEHFDADYFENAFVKWDKTLREQSLARVRNICRQIAHEGFQVDIRQLDQMINTELEKEERILDVILRNFNNNPAVFINAKVNVFITEVATQLFSVSQHLYAMRQDDRISELKADKIARLIENPDRMSSNQRQYKYLCSQAQLQMTALLLSIEQLLYNEYNPNLLQSRHEEKLDAQARLTAQLIQRTTDIRQVEERVFKYFAMWMQYPVFLDEELPVELRITFLQALFLIIDVPSSMSFFKKSEVPLEFITKLIGRVVKEQGHERIIEDSLILLVTQRMLRVDLNYTCPQLALKDTLDQLVQIAIRKKPLQKYIKQILYLISQNTHYSTNVIEVLERNNGNHQDLERLRAQSNSDFLNQVWRAKPSSANHARTRYEWNDNLRIDRTTYAKQIDKLPILSPDSIKKIRYEFLPDNLREYIETTLSTSQVRLNQSRYSRLSPSAQQQNPQKWAEEQRRGPAEPVIEEEDTPLGAEEESTSDKQPDTQMAEAAKEQPATDEVVVEVLDEVASGEDQE